jgi:hypothetical protein
LSGTGPGKQHPVSRPLYVPKTGARAAVRSADSCLLPGRWPGRRINARRKEQHQHALNVGNGTCRCAGCARPGCNRDGTARRRRHRFRPQRSNPTTALCERPSGSPEVPRQSPDLNRLWLSGLADWHHGETIVEAPSERRPMVQLTPDPVLGPTLVKNWMAGRGWMRKVSPPGGVSPRCGGFDGSACHGNRSRSAQPYACPWRHRDPPPGTPDLFTGARDQALLPGQLLRKAASISVLTRRHP